MESSQAGFRPLVVGGRRLSTSCPVPGGTVLGAVSVSNMSSKTGAAFDRLVDAVAAVADLDPGEFDAAETETRLRTLRPMIDQLEGVFAGLTRRFDAAGSYHDCGARSTAAWLRHQLRLSAAEAHRHVRLARTLPGLPGTCAALAAGQISLAHARVLGWALDQIGVTAMADAEDTLLQLARLVDPGDLRTAVNELRQVLDPDALERDYVAALDKRQVACVAVGDGYHLSGFLDAESGALVATAIHAFARRHGVDDQRSAGQRRADALTDICRTSLETGDTGLDNGVRPHLNVVVDWTRLRSNTRQPGGEPGNAGNAGNAGHSGDGHSDGRVPPARLEGFGPIPDTLVAKLGCDAGIARIVTDATGAPLNLGRTARTAQPHQRRGIAIRDRGRCRTPGCGNRLVHLPHVVHWADGGPTDIDRIVSACPRCHTMIHLGLITVEALGAGRFRYRDRHHQIMLDTTRDAEDLLHHWLDSHTEHPPPQATHQTHRGQAHRRRQQLRL